MVDEADIAEQFEKHLSGAKQSWLLGAGASYSGNVPLMQSLTARVMELARTEKFGTDQDALNVLEFIEGDTVQGSHIEIFLTHLADLISMAERARTNSISIANNQVAKVKLTAVHNELLQLIAEIIRWGYKAPTMDGAGNIIAEVEIGEVGRSIVAVDEYDKFVKALFGARRAGLENIRGPVQIFTTNYDTLIEDALALNQIEYVDGFSGGGVGYWSPSNYDRHSASRAILTKLHGSIDWYRPVVAPSPLLRIRHGDVYPGDGGAVMIYPQATKYMTTQLDPFSELFQRFRKRLTDSVDQVLLVCGYSFGDDHINAEIECAMSAAKSQLTIIAFSNEGEHGLPTKLQTWRSQTSWRDRIYVASPNGLYRGKSGPAFTVDEGSRDWWTFGGATRLLSDGLPKDVQETIR